MGAIVLAVLLVAYVGISYRYADQLTRVKRDPLHVPTAALAVTPDLRGAALTPASVVAPTHEDVSFRTADGLTLKGWWFTPLQPRDRAVVFVHGKDQNRIDSSFDPAPTARLLLSRGYSVLLFDLRGHGESQGLRWGLGGKEALDVAAAVDLAAKKAGLPRSRVAVIGESMGASSALMALAYVPDAGPMVLDSAYESASAVVNEDAPAISGLPAFFTPGMVLMARLFFGIDINAIRPIDEVRAHPERAFLFIQCEDDTTVREHHGLDLKAASADPQTELWLVPGCEHVKAFTTHPAEWQRHVTSFLERQLGP